MALSGRHGQVVPSMFNLNLQINHILYLSIIYNNYYYNDIN